MKNNRSLNTSIHKQCRDGSALIVVILFTFLMFYVLKGFLPSLVTDYRGSTRNLQKNVAFYIAEAGAEEAMWALNNVGDGDWTTEGWTQTTDMSGNIYWKREIDFSGEIYDLDNNFSAKIRIVAEQPIIGAPTKVYSEGIILNSSGEQVMNDIIEIQARSPKIFQGLIAKDQLTFTNNSIFASYDSTIHSAFPVPGINTGADLHLDGSGNTDWDAVPFFVGSASSAAGTVSIDSATIDGSLVSGQASVTDAISGSGYSVSGQVIGGYVGYFNIISEPDTTGWSTSF